MGVSINGVSSGLDVDSIVNALVSAESGQKTQLTKQKSTLDSKISAFGKLKSSLSAFQTAINSLATTSKFDVQKATVSDNTVFTATANGKASNTDYAVKVNQLAKNHKISSAGITGVDTPIGTGKLTIQLGTYAPAVVGPPASGNTFTNNPDKPSVEITIDSSNNTLSGVRDAINAANAGVTASIINDGTTNRLVLSSKETGEVNSIKMTVNDDDGVSTDTTGLSRLAYDPTASVGAGKNMEQRQAAQNALLNVDGIDISKSSNTITDAVQGVTLNLLKTSADTVSMSIASDTETIKSNIQKFVEAYNTLNTTITDLTKYNEASKTGSILLGDSTTRSIANQIKNTIIKSVGTSGTLNTLSQIGVAFQRDGTLALDSTKLDTAIKTKPAEIAALFSVTVTATDSQVTYVSSTNKTQAGTYAINVTTLGSSTVATVGSINGVAANGVETNLVGATGDASEGLNLRILGTSTGARGSVTVTVGIAAQLNRIMSDIMNTDGILESKTKSLTTNANKLSNLITAQDDRLAAVEKRYRAQFTALEATMNSLNSTSSFLSSQLASLSSNR